MTLRPLLFALALAFVSGCDAPNGSPSRGGGRNGPGSATPIGASGVHFVAAPADGDVAELVRRARDEATRSHRTLLVYIGATWCEPCQYFHRAVEAHRLDADFPALTLLEFDFDRDNRRLAPAGYVSRMIPLFARPGADGRASGQQMEGSIHGPDSVQEIVPRLRGLIGS